MGHQHLRHLCLLAVVASASCGLVDASHGPATTAPPIFDSATQQDGPGGTVGGGFATTTRPPLGVVPTLPGLPTTPGLPTGVGDSGTPASPSAGDAGVTGAGVPEVPLPSIGPLPSFTIPVPTTTTTTTTTIPQLPNDLCVGLRELQVALHDFRFLSFATPTIDRLRSSTSRILRALDQLSTQPSGALPAEFPAIMRDAAATNLELIVAADPSLLLARITELLQPHQPEIESLLIISDAGCEIIN